MRVRRIGVIVASSLLLGTARMLGAQAAGLARADAVRLAEAFRVSDALGERLWPGWNAAPFAVLLVTPEREFLLRHSAPTREFTDVGVDSIVHERVWSRPPVFPVQMQATFPAVGGVPTIVIGTAERTGSTSSTRWVLTLLHEHFHQLQYSRPSYQAAVEALGLQRGDSTGMWMLDFPFPYDKAPVAERFASMARSLGGVLAARDSATFGERLGKFVEAKRSFRALLADDEARYLGFQLWQEGIARYSEVRLAQLADADAAHELASYRALGDYTPYGEVATAIVGGIARELADERLAETKRVVVYGFGAAEGLVLDRASPAWRARYLARLFSLDDGFGLP